MHGFQVHSSRWFAWLPRRGPLICSLPMDINGWEPYEGSDRQRRRRRVVRLVAVVAAAAMLVPIIWASIDAIAS
mgnify:CR=1 FL=1